MESPRLSQDRPADSRERSSRTLEVVVSGDRASVYLPKEQSLHRAAHMLRDVYDREDSPQRIVVLSPGRKFSSGELLECFPPQKYNLVIGDGALEDETIRGHENLDHHDRKQNRLVAPSMCQLAAQGLEAGRFNKFLNNRGGRKGMKSLIIVNHIDQDTAQAIMEFDLFGEYSPEKRSKIHELSNIVGRTDARAGVIAHTQSTAEMLKWWSEPILQARKKHKWLLDDISARELSAVLDEVRIRTVEYIEGRPDFRALDTGYKPVKTSWGSFIPNENDDTRRQLALEGVLRFLSYRGTNAAGKHIYSFANLDESDQRGKLPVAKLCDFLNRLEAIVPEHWNKPIAVQWHYAQRVSSAQLKKLSVWGGNGVGGSFPGSRISPNRIVEYVNFVLGQHLEQTTAIRVINFARDLGSAFKDVVVDNMRHTSAERVLTSTKDIASKIRKTLRFP